MICRLTIALLGLVSLLETSQAAPAAPSPVVYYVQLVWGTDYAKPKKAQFRPVGPKLKRDLARVFRWKHYWEIRRRRLVVKPDEPTRVRLSSECEVEIELISGSVRETRIYGKGVLTSSSRQKIPSQKWAIHGGTTEVGGSWFVVVREDKPADHD